MSRRIPGRLQDRCLEKNVTTRNRFHRYGNGYALAVEQLEWAKAQGATQVRLLERESCRILRASMTAFSGHGISHHDPRYEPQVVLPLRFWTIEDPARGNLFEGKA